MTGTNVAQPPSAVSGGSFFLAVSTEEEREEKEGRDKDTAEGGCAT
jgi:hypothetical protein